MIQSPFLFAYFSFRIMKGVIYMYDFVKSNGTIALVQEVPSDRYLVIDRRTDEVLKKGM